MNIQDCKYIKETSYRFMKKNWKYYLCSSKIHQKEGINKVDPITQPICYKKGNPEKCPWFKKENKLEKEAKEK